MKIIVFRHGEAEEKRPGMSDEERRLTEKGRRDVECVARALPWRPFKIYTSPLVRAFETAEIIARIYGIDIIATDRLRPETASIESIRELQLVDGVVLVGHAPSIERLVSDLIGGGNVRLRAGSAAGLEIENICEGCAKLVFLVTPEISCCKQV